MPNASPDRPRHVVIVDAENPLAEVRGEFYWREDHEKLVAAARDEAFRDGYAQGFASGQSTARPLRIVVRRRFGRRPILRLLLTLVSVSLLLSILLTLVQLVASRL